jgi:hypothetical protein
VSTTADEIEVENQAAASRRFQGDCAFVWRRSMVAARQEPEAMRLINSRLALCGFERAYHLGKENRRLGDIPAMAVSLNAGDPAIQRRSREKVTSSFSNPKLLDGRH